MRLGCAPGAATGMRSSNAASASSAAWMIRSIGDRIETAPMPSSLALEPLPGNAVHVGYGRHGDATTIETPASHRIGALLKARLTLLLSVTLALSALPVSAALAASQLFRSPSGSYVLEYPSTLKLHMASGRACANGACRPIEQASLDGPDGSMTLA